MLEIIFKILMIVVIVIIVLGWLLIKSDKQEFPD